MGAAISSAARAGDWMMTFTGRQFWPLDPRPEDVDVRDVAQALANQGRYNGHTRHYLSVAQHCVELARWFAAKGKRHEARWALLHDAAEAYTGDLIRPLKPFVAGFSSIEARVEHVVFAALGLEGEVPAEVKVADRHITTDEMLALFPPEAMARYGIDKRPRLGLEIRPWFPNVARDRFLGLHAELFGARPA